MRTRGVLVAGGDDTTGDDTADDDGGVEDAFTEGADEHAFATTAKPANSPGVQRTIGSHV